MATFVVETLINGDWENTWWLVDDDGTFVMGFHSSREAMDALDKHFSHMVDYNKSYDEADYRVVQLD